MANDLGLRSDRLETLTCKVMTLERRAKTHAVRAGQRRFMQAPITCCYALNLKTQAFGDRCGAREAWST